MPHQRFELSRDPKLGLTEILKVSHLRHNLLAGSSIVHKIHLGISVSNVERDRGQLHQALGVQGRVAIAKPLGRDETSDKGVEEVSDAGSLGAGGCTVGSARSWRKGSGSCSGAGDWDEEADSAELSSFFSFLRL